MQDPKPINLTGEELEQVKLEIANSSLTDSTKNLIFILIQMSIWLRLKLEHSRVSINKLKRLFFVSNEKRSASNSRQYTDSINYNTTKTDSNGLAENNTIDKPSASTVDKNSTKSLDKPKGHGRLSANDYTNSEVVVIPHAEYVPDQDCPTECGGRLYDTNKPGLFIHIEGNSLFKATKYDSHYKCRGLLEPSILFLYQNRCNDRHYRQNIAVWY